VFQRASESGDKAWFELVVTDSNSWEQWQAREFICVSIHLPFPDSKKPCIFRRGWRTGNFYKL
jgi:hypothetical protein